jgi:hypothetical protein
VTVVVFLEPRDMPWMWALSRRRGRRDTLIVRAQLRGPPGHELEILDPESWSGREALPRVQQDWTHRGPAALGEPAIHCDVPSTEQHAEAMLAVARHPGLVVRRLSVRRSAPHLQLHVAPPSATASASAFFETIRALGERARGADLPSAVRR